MTQLTDNLFVREECIVQVVEYQELTLLASMELIFRVVCWLAANWTLVGCS